MLSTATPLVGYLKKRHSDFTLCWLRLFVKQKGISPAKSSCQGNVGVEMGSEISWPYFHSYTVSVGESAS